MDITGIICTCDGQKLYVDGFDTILFSNDTGNVEQLFTGYSLQKSNESYHEVLNCLSRYAFIGLRRHDNENELIYAGEKIAFKHRHQESDIVIEQNETLYLQTSAIATIIRQ